MDSPDLFGKIENAQPIEGSLDLGCKWNFIPHQKGSMKRGREDSSFNPFKDHEIRCLVREYIQNSMDAAQEISKNEYKKVLVTFSYGELKCSDYPNLIRSLLGRLKACSDRCKLLSGAKDTFKSKYDFLKSHYNGSIGYLKVSDSNTTGMDYVDDDETPSGFDSCVQSSSSSYKPNGRAGGSQGLGKTVGFVNSPLNAVYYSTMHEETGHTFGEGVIRLCSHKYINDNGDYILFEPDAFYNKGGSPNSGNDIPAVFRRDQPGTDAFVLGMEKREEDIITMKEELLRGFFYAIFKEKLDVIICGELFTKNNLEEQMEKYFPESKYSVLDLDRSNSPELYFNPRPYLFEIAMHEELDDNHIILSTDDFPGQFPCLGHATLQIWKNEDIKTSKSVDKVIFMRNKLMTIEVKKYYSSKGYYGILICDGDGDEYLRMLENVTHDKWDEKEVRELDEKDKKKKKKTHRELERFREECIKKLFPEEHDKPLEIKSLRMRKIGKFGNRSEENEKDDIWPTTNNLEKTRNDGKVSESFSIFEVDKGRKRKRKKGTKTDVPPEVEATPPNPKPGPKPGPEPEPEPEPTSKPPYVTGEGSEEGIGEGVNPKAEREIEIKLDGRNKRLKPLHDGEFAYQLEIRVPRDYYDCRLVIEIQADDGEFPLDMKRVSAGYKIRPGIPNEIYGFDLKTNASNVIKFTPQENSRIYSLRIKAYGH